VSTPAERGDGPPPSPLDAAWRRHLSTDTSLLTRLVGRHREKHRRYHTAAHVEAVVGVVIELDAQEPADDLGAVIAAAMYHDAVYEPASPANERASARLARRDLGTLGWEPERVARVAHMIEATSDHLAPPDHDHALLFDADLGILGADGRAYAAYADAVRAEYRHVDDDAWRVGRRRVLESLLERPEIYATTTGRSRWEATARANMADELESLNG
jgi:predicted metal-dependent HD superfamily phosphohydrolase